ncbi:N-acetylmuramoyl-L-alanine amidase [Thermodesulfovibrio thiophilus]|uniref:N-acetylmuramoyl-L-alanine amidase n=1 Tax=Thermodesulfovibrio thiophilus TaxID=340095 RepID=UPI00179410B0|nr:N-acetylmuramoyl-L-alanine amidase [Thermodesulfovibrio thiophilus]HHW20428.1 N-acetylmuramoyl-L-alanine amidase [Thermodesulfovibrio thiophilus]
MSRIFIILFLLIPLSWIWAEDRQQIKDIRYYELSQGVRVVVETNGVVEFARGQLKNPERVFFDIKNSLLNKEARKEFLVNNSVVNKIRVGQFDTSTVRIVFELLKPDYEFKVIQLENPFRLVIDIYLKGGSKQLSKELEKKKESQISLKRTIVIDPGHGGKDPGAIGPTGLKEKDVVLDVALKVRELLKSDPQYDIVLTRDQDIFIPLNKRTEIANKINADLFISIHANASTNSYARGVETYLLNWTDDEEAIRVAARENAISVKKMKQLKGELGFMLASLEREAKRDDSVRLAGYIHNSMADELKNDFSRHNNGVKQALFYVLVGAQMPSCLLEISYISNPEEERLLDDESYRMKIAQSLVEGIKNYFIKTDQIKKVKYTKHNSSPVKTNTKKIQNKKEKTNL